MFSMTDQPRRWSNWSRSEFSRPVHEIVPRSIEQLVLAVERARETGHTVKPIGGSHSFTGIAATDGIRIDLSRMRGLVSADRLRARVTLWGGTHLYELPAILAPLGLALENMGDIDRQTITGATQTGTHGTGLTLGGLSTGVVAATLVTGTGEVRKIDEDHSPELLPSVALGLGALGVLATITIQCVPQYLLHAEEAPASLAEVLETWGERSRFADHFEFYWFPHTRGARTKTNTRLPIDAVRDPLGRLSKFIDEELMNNLALGAMVATERIMPAITPRVNRLIEGLSSRRSYTDLSHRVFITRRAVRFREMEYAIPYEAVPSAMREIDAMIERQGFRISFPVEVRAAAADDRLLSTAYERESGYIAVHRFWREDPTKYFREVEAIFHDHAGRPHWGKMHSLGAEKLRERYPRFDDFLLVRDQFDPDRVFQNPYLSRVLGP
jgi:FAD-linked oxidoreductase